MEYLIVHCPEKRRVLVDGIHQGETESTIELELMKDLEKETRQTRRYVADGQARLDRHCPNPPRLSEPAPLRTCLVEANFEALPDEKTRQRFLNLPTTFALPRQDVDALIAVAQLLLAESPAFQRLRRALGAAPAARDPDPNCT